MIHDMERLPRGVLRPAEDARLLELATDKLVLEMGCWQGRTTARLAAYARRVWTVDGHRGDSWTGPADTREAYFEHLEDTGAWGRVVTVVGEFKNVREVLTEAHFDLVFVDGDHTFAAVHHDLRWAEQLCKVGGRVAAHDWNVEDVQRAALGLLGLPTEVVENLAVWYLRP